MIIKFINHVVSQCSFYRYAQARLCFTKVYLLLIFFLKNKDSLGTKFYLILTGSVGVHVLLPSITDNVENYVLTEVKILRAGSSFGELALISKKPRAATIICKEDCNFGVLEKKDFNRILKSNEEKKLIEEMNFLAEMKLFQHWNFNLIKQLYLNTHTMHLIKEDWVFQENEESEAVYIIKYGEFVKTKQINDLSINDNTIKNWKEFLKDRSKKKIIDIAILGNGELFGEEDLINGNKREYGIKCLSPKGIIMIINRKNFFTRVYNDKNTQIMIDEIIIKKDKWMSNKVQEIQKINKINHEKNRKFEEKNKIEFGKDEIIERYVRIKKSKCVESVDFLKRIREKEDEKSVNQSYSKFFDIINSSIVNKK